MFTATPIPPLQTWIRWMLDALDRSWCVQPPPLLLCSPELVLQPGALPDRVPHEVRRETAPRPESVEERAARLMSMLTSGEVGSRAELARHLGVSRSYITKVLRQASAAAG